MPTGYTAGIADGTITDFKTFIMRLARGMGALVTMRDEPMDAPIPDKFEPSDYHKTKYEEAFDSLFTLKIMSPQEWEKSYNSYVENQEVLKKEAVEKNEQLRERYSRFLKMANDWENAPVGLKEFAIEQLQQSIDFDVSDDIEKYYEILPYDQWQQKELKSATFNLNYHAKEHADEIIRVSRRNQWLKQLRKSLDALE